MLYFFLAQLNLWLPNRSFLGHQNLWCPRNLFTWMLSPVVSKNCVFLNTITVASKKLDSFTPNTCGVHEIFLIAQHMYGDHTGVILDTKTCGVQGISLLGHHNFWCAIQESLFCGVKLIFCLGHHTKLCQRFFLLPQHNLCCPLVMELWWPNKQK